MAIRRDNENLSETPFPKELRALLDASPVYDIDNVYLSEEGWIYRHYKSANKSRWWDEILFSGEVDTTDADNAPVSATVSAGVKLGSSDYTPTLEVGDNTPGFGYGDTIVDAGVPAPPPAPAPITSIGGVNIDIVPTAMTVGVNSTFAASIGGDANVTWEWRKASGPGNATISFPNSATTQIQVDAAGDYVFTAEASSTDENLTGGSPNSLNTGTITATAPIPTIGTVTISGPVTATVGEEYTYTASWTGDADPAQFSYLWTAPNGTEVSGGDTNAITLTWDAVFAASNLFCAISSTQADVEEEEGGIQVNVQAAASVSIGTLSITGDNFATINETKSYSLSHFGGGATQLAYAWSVTGGTVSTGQGTSTAQIEWTAAGAGNVECEVTASDTNITGENPKTVSRAVTVDPIYDVDVRIDSVNGTDGYILSNDVTGENATINLNVGETLKIATTLGAHPIYIKTAPSTGTGDLVTGEGTITGQGTTSGILTWDTAGASTGTYYYQCSEHADMGGEIIIS